MERISGRIFDGSGFIDATVIIENGVITEVSDIQGPPVGIVVPSLVDCHTHVGDAGLVINKKMTLEELVAPPDGLKHRYLKETSSDEISAHMHTYLSKMNSFGTGHFADFRECGMDGAMLLKGISGPDRTILGRPVSMEYDWNEVESLLNVADGLGISSISDIPSEYLDALADHVRKRKKILAIHGSERVREDIDRILSLDPKFIVHMNESTDRDMRKCSDDDVPVVVCPRSNMYFDRITPLKRLLDANVTIGLGTDNAMIGDADLRRECAVLREMLGGRPHAEREITDILLVNGRKILYHGREIGIRAGMNADVSVFPYGKHGNIWDVIQSAGTPVRNMDVMERNGYGV